MTVDHTIMALRALAYAKTVPAVAHAAGVSDDTLRRILSDSPPGWLNTYRKLEELAESGLPEPEGQPAA